MKHRETLLLILISILSIVLGVIYSIHNTDALHWGFITGTVLDFIHGKKLFTEIYIQYGIGQPIVFNFLNHLFPVNFSTVGIVTSAVYVLNLWVLNRGMKWIAGGAIAALMSFILFLIHPFAIYPWPDYWAGLCLSLASFFWIKNSKLPSTPSWLAGVFLFCAFLFRFTYSINITAGCIAYAVLCLFNKNIRSKQVISGILVFFSLTTLYLGYLALQQHLGLWYDEAIGSASTQYHVDGDSILLLLKRIFLPARFWLPNNQVTTTVSALFYFSIFALYRLLQRKEKDSGLYAFLILLGMAGIVQASMLYEMFRIQNACSPLYLVVALFVAMKFPDLKALLARKPILYGIALYVILLFFKFPYASSIFPLYDGKWSEYSESQIPVFKGHRFREEEHKYYQDLVRLLCGQKKQIVNMTRDSTIGYLCPGQSAAHILPFYSPPMISMIDPKQIEDEKSGRFHPDQIVVVENPSTNSPFPVVPDVRMIEIGRTQRPSGIRFMYTETIAIYRVERI